MIRPPKEEIRVDTADAQERDNQGGLWSHRNGLAHVHCICRHQKSDQPRG